MSVAAPPHHASSSSVSSLLSTLKQGQTFDYLRAGSNADLVKLLAASAKAEGISTSETVLFADELIKINRKQKRQERVLVVTDRALYNFAVDSFKSFKRRIPVASLKGVIMSKGSDELVLQVSDDYDYRYDCRRRSELLEMLSRAFEAAHVGQGSSVQLMVSFSDEAQLKDQVLTKDHLKAMQHMTVSEATAGNGKAVPAQTAQQQQQQPHQRQPSGGTHASAPPAATVIVEPPSTAYSSPSPAPASASTPSPSPSPTSSSSRSAQYPAASSSGSAGAAAAHSPAPNSPTSAGSTLQLPGGPKSPTSGNNKSLRRSLITHGTALLAPQVLAKIDQQRANGNGSAPAHAASAASGPSADSTVSPAPSPSHAEVYRKTKKPSIFASLLGVVTSSSSSDSPKPQTRASSKTVTAPPTSQAGSGAAKPAFRDPTSRVEGWLTKKKGSSTKWDRKYFILTSSHLSYFEPRIKGNTRLEPKTITVTRQDSHDAPAIAVAHRSSATSDDSALGSSGRGAPGPLVVLCIESKAQKSKKEPLLLAFATEDDANEWTQAFLHRNGDERVDETEMHPHLEGWLLHREWSTSLLTSSSGGWARRYVVLTGDRVWFLEMAEKGCISFSAGVSAFDTREVEPTEAVTAAGAPAVAGRASQTRFSHRFNVSDSERIFYLAADSAEDCAAWIQSVEAVNREHGRGGGSASAAAAAAAADAGSPESAAAALSATGSGVSPDSVAGSINNMPAAFLSSVAQPAPEGQVSFVFTDVQSSTSLWEKHPDAMDAALALHDRLLRELLLLYRGYEVKTEGDAFMVTFFTPVEAALWCLHTQLALCDAQWSDELCAHPAARREEKSDPEGKPITVFNGIRIRMGVHVGYPNARRNPITGRMDYFGPVVNRSARVSDTAHGGQVVGTQEVVDALRAILDPATSAETAATLLAAGVSQASLDRLLAGASSSSSANSAAADDAMAPLIRDEGTYALKGIPEPVRVFQIMPKRLALRELPPLRA
jgi:class 3 adenylate cyclase